jgi:hypothetical protein
MPECLHALVDSRRHRPPLIRSVFTTCGLSFGFRHLDAIERGRASARLFYGDRWQTQLAKALGMSSRIVRRWVSCEAQIPWPLLDEILPSSFPGQS